MQVTPRVVAAEPASQYPRKTDIPGPVSQGYDALASERQAEVLVMGPSMTWQEAGLKAMPYTPDLDRQLVSDIRTYLSKMSKGIALNQGQVEFFTREVAEKTAMGDMGWAANMREGLETNQRSLLGAPEELARMSAYYGPLITQAEEWIANYERAQSGA